MGNLISFRLVRALGLTGIINPALRGKPVSTGAGPFPLLGTVILPWLEDPDGRPRGHEPTPFHVWECQDHECDIIMGDEWCMENNALNVVQRPKFVAQGHVIRWATDEGPGKFLVLYKYNRFSAFPVLSSCAPLLLELTSR